MFSDDRIVLFREKVWALYIERGRDMPWRTKPTPYNVAVSEIMLQQTQVDRVRVKFEAWIRLWPDFSALSMAMTEDVLRMWQGLGYNRRALWLQSMAQQVVHEYNGNLPDNHQRLVAMKGIGPNTAGAILAYAFEQPVVFIETNIRRVMLHEFFPDRDEVPDKELLPLVGAVLDREHPREWYWAMMDYGTELAKSVVNPNRRSKHYTRQSKFEGSHRQLRGAILAYLLAVKRVDTPALASTLGRPKAAIAQAVDELVREGFLMRDKNGITMKS